MIYSFDTDLAKDLGVNESIILNNFVFWLAKNKANNQNFFDERYWTFNSVRAYKELFPFWSESQIKRTIKSLVDKDVLVVGNYNNMAYDRTNWYALSNRYSYLIHSTNSSNGTNGNSQPIPDIKPDSKTHIYTYDEYASLWNSFASKCNKSKIVKLTDTRKTKIKKRIEDSKNFLKAFEIALLKASDSKFLKDGSFFSFDWLIENDTNIIKVLEDKYKDKSEKKWGDEF